MISANPRYLGITLLIIAASAILFSQTAWASPGEKVYVQKSSVNIRTGPGTNNAVLLKLNLGHELIEFSRRGEWINVGIPRTGGKDGWIHSSLVGPVSPGGATTAPKDRRFDAFLKDVEKLNAKVEPITGFPFFTKVENLGDGIVQLTAHDQWLKAPRSERESNLNTLYRLWSAQENSGLPVAVYIVDARSNLVMKKASP